MLIITQQLFEPNLDNHSKDGIENGIHDSRKEIEKLRIMDYCFGRKL